jgi:thioredoxin reductase (NADPH)
MNGPTGTRLHASAALRAPLLDHDDAALFPKLTEAQVQMLSPLGKVRPTAAGEVLFRRHGDVPSFDVFVVLEGSVSVVVGSGEEARELVLLRPGDLLAELNIFTGENYIGATGIVREAGSVLAVPADAFRALVGRQLSFGNFVLQTLFRRREALERLRLGLRIVGSRFDRDTQRLREFAVRNRLIHEWVDADDDRGQAWLAGLAVEDAASPVVLVAGEKLLVNPTNAELSRAVGLRQPPPADERTYDVVVVGAGPGGLAASVYAATGGLSTALLDAVAVGGQAATSARIDNYLGFPAGVSGAELAERAEVQAGKFGVDIMVPCRAVGLAERDGFHVVALENGDELVACSVILAIGVHYRRLSIPRLADYEGAGVAYAADVARAQLAPGEHAVVVGGANSAGQAALTLAEDGHHVYLVVRGETLEADMSRYLRERVAREPAVEVMLGHEIRAIDGEGRLERVTVEQTRTGERRDLDAGAMVVLIGARPPTEWLAAELDLDDNGFVLTGPALGSAVAQCEPWQTLGRPPFIVETSRPGVFAVGDVRSGSTKMVAPAAGAGAMATQFVHEHLARTPAAAR